MFGFLYELMAGQHGELSRRRRADPSVEFDRRAGSFVSVDGADLETEWLGRGEIPGQRAREAARRDADARGTVADEMRTLAK